MADDDSEKTEEPTGKKLQDAINKGNFPSSQEFKTWFLFLFATAAVAGGAPWLAREISEVLQGYMQRLHEISTDTSGTLQPMVTLVWDIFWIMIIPFMVFLVGGIVGNVVQQPFVFVTDKIKPDLKKVDPISGFKKKFGVQVLVEFAKNLAKLIVVSTLVFLIIWPEREKLDTIMMFDVFYILVEMHEMAIAMFVGILIFMTVIAAADFTWTRHKHHESMKMTKQEVKDERKQTDGDPLVKGKIRALRMERSRQRMMANVPNADVVVTNPTHYAVALEYKHGQNDVPVLLAKGVDAVAFKIREVAEENGIPIIENPPVARALYAAVEIDEEIPPEHYKTVAEIIGYIMRLGKRRLKLN